MAAILFRPKCVTERMQGNGADIFSFSARIAFSDALRTIVEGELGRHRDGLRA